MSRSPAENGATPGVLPLRRRRRTVLLLLLAVAAHLPAFLAVGSFVLDDAFVTFRYAQHLTEGEGIRYNRAEDPSEGFTSYLWLAISAIGHSVGTGPLLAVRVASLAATVLLFALLATAPAPLAERAALLGSLALHPGLALLSAQGLETTGTAALLALTVHLSLKYRLEPAPAVAWGLIACALASIAARPDTVPFLTALGAQQLWSMRSNRHALKLLGGPTALFGSLGLVFFLWRWSYFGHFLPNTFYIKTGASVFGLNAHGVAYAASFLMLWIAPPIAVWWLLRRPEIHQLLRSPPGAVLLAVGAHLTYLATVLPIQGFLGRFGLPVLPALLLALLHFERAPVQRQPAMQLTAAAALWAVTLLWWPTVLHEMKQRTQTDRVAAGRALAGLQGVMFTAAAGALPYYSQWQAADRLGLTSEEIAHEGLTLDFLDRLAPDLVVVPASGFDPDSANLRWATTARFVRQNEFRIITCMRRGSDFDLCYFVRPDSRLRSQIEARLRHLPGVRHSDTQWFHHP